MSAQAEAPLESPLEDFLEFKLIPTHGRPEPSKLPLTIYFSIPVLDHGVSVSLILHSLFVKSSVPLMSSPQLVVAKNFLLGDFLPFRCSDVVLRVDEGIPQEACVAHDPNELFGRQIIPFMTINLAIVDLKGKVVSIQGSRGGEVSENEASKPSMWEQVFCAACPNLCRRSCRPTQR